MDATTTAEFEAERHRLRRLAGRLLDDPHEAEDIVQKAWLRWQRTTATIDNLPAWLTTVTTRLCLDRLRARVAEPAEPADIADDRDPASDVALADSVGVALRLVLERLSPTERVAFVLHDSFGFDFSIIAAALDVSPAAARKLASRARAKVAQPAAEDRLAEWEVVDAFMSAARGGDFDRLIGLLVPDAGVSADGAAIAAGTPERMEGARSIAAFFNGSAHAALGVLVDGRAAYAWFHRGVARVVFDFDVDGGAVRHITFRADPALLRRVVRREVAGAPETGLDGSDAGG